MSPEARGQAIRARLQVALGDCAVTVVDESAQHAGHAGARGGKGHFRVRVVSPAFAGHGPLARHRMVYRALGELMDTDIHALGIEALTPEETGA